MIRPKSFAFNWETAGDNEFQKVKARKDFSKEALAEFDQLTDRLVRNKVSIEIFEDVDIQLPDAVFLNNWFSTSPEGVLSIFPMKSPVRRTERRQDILNYLIQNYQVRKILDFTSREEENHYLEGTGSIIPDFKNKLAYLSESERSHPGLFSEWCQEMGLLGVSFGSKSLSGKDIYHTNVLMHVGKDWSVICSDCIENPIERKMVLNKLRDTGKELIEISYRQMENFCGNIFEVNSENGPAICMSERAFKSFETVQINALERFANIVYSPIPNIENVGGGGVRCMMAGNYLPTIPHQ
jgi:hypothetical protein